MKTRTVALKNSEGKVFIVPAGPVSLVGIVAEKGLVGCGAIDVAALDGFGYAAVRVKPPAGKTSIGDAKDLFAGTVKEANAAAKALGVAEGMTGKEAADLLS